MDYGWVLQSILCKLSQWESPEMFYRLDWASFLATNFKRVMFLFWKMRRQGTSENNTTLSLRESSMIRPLSIWQDSDVRSDPEDRKRRTAPQYRLMYWSTLQLNSAQGEPGLWRPQVMEPFQDRVQAVGSVQPQRHGFSAPNMHCGQNSAMNGFEKLRTQAYRLIAKKTICVLIFANISPCS